MISNQWLNINSDFNIIFIIFNRSHINVDFNIIVAQCLNHFDYTHPKCIQLGVNCISKGLFHQQQQNDKFITDLGPFTYSCSVSGQLLNPPSPLVEPISQEKPFLSYLSISVHGKIVSSVINKTLGTPPFGSHLFPPL